MTVGSFLLGLAAWVGFVFLAIAVVVVVMFATNNWSGEKE